MSETLLNVTALLSGVEARLAGGAATEEGVT
jgi:hypothetical protein